MAKKTSNVAQGAAFEKEVGRILSLKGYTVTRNNLINGTQIDLLATKGDPLDKVSLVVECADRDVPIGVDLVKEKASVLLSLQGAPSLYRLMFVARNGFTAEAKAFADAQPNVTVLSANELENLLVDLTPYANWYIHNYERSLGIFKDANLHTNYIDLSARDEKQQLVPSLGKFVRNWLRDEETNLLFLLGDYGAGKTSFSRHLAYSLLREKYVGHEPSVLTPILINLRDNKGRFDLKSVVVDSLVNLYGVDLQSFAAFERLCETGKVVLLLDGFDEMSDRSTAEALIDSFNQIYLFATLNAKVLLTCRSNFFKTHADIIELLRHFSISIPLQQDNQVVELALKDQGKVLYVEKLSPTQIREFVEKRFGAKADEMLAAIGRIHDLSDLSTRPVLLDMIVSTLPELERAKSRINSAALYDHYTSRWTTRDQWRVSIPLKIRITFCEILAWSMHCANANGIPFSLLEQIMVSTLEVMAAGPEQLEKFKNDIQTCSFLIRAPESDEFRFAHKSFREFFVARKVIADLTAGVSIERPSTSELFPEKNNSRVVLDANWFYLSPGSGRASMLQYLRSGLNDRIRSSNVFLSMMEAEVASTWGLVSRDASVRTHFESEIRAIFSKEWLTAFSSEIAISEEIATFAIELLANGGVAFDELVSKVTSEASINVLCDVLRLAQSPDWVQQNADQLKAYVSTGANSNLKVACAAALARHPNLVPVEFVRKARGSLSEEGWSYFLFELASEKNQYAQVLSSLLKDDNLGAVDQVICLYGVGGTLPADDADNKLPTLIAELLQSENRKERSLAATVCSSLPLDRRVAVISKAFRGANGKALKNHLLQLLQEVAGGDAWQALRALAATEQDAETKMALRSAETMLRNIASERKNRESWNRIKNHRDVREAMWRSRN